MMGCRQLLFSEAGLQAQKNPRRATVAQERRSPRRGFLIKHYQPTPLSFFATSASWLFSFTTSEGSGVAFAAQT
jgi:hypothetical protein